jgi:hypothetical protein
MQDYCGKNGCYEIETGDDFEGQLFCIFLNSPISYVINQRGESVRAVAGERPDADVVFELYEDTDTVLYTGRMTVNTLFSHGVKEFVSALLEREQDIAGKDGLIKVVKNLLDADGAAWGIIHQDPDAAANTWEAVH